VLYLFQKETIVGVIDLSIFLASLYLLKKNFDLEKEYKNIRS